ncbi:hypothetical protein [Arthrobacter sp. Sr24]
MPVLLSLFMAGNPVVVEIYVVGSALELGVDTTADTEISIGTAT